MQTSPKDEKHDTGLPRLHRVSICRLLGRLYALRSECLENSEDTQKGARQRYRTKVGRYHSAPRTQLRFLIAAIVRLGALSGGMGDMAERKPGNACLKLEKAAPRRRWARFVHQHYFFNAAVSNTDPFADRFHTPLFWATNKADSKRRRACDELYAHHQRTRPMMLVLTAQPLLWPPSWGIGTFDLSS